LRALFYAPLRALFYAPLRALFYAPLRALFYAPLRALCKLWVAASHSFDNPSGKQTV